MPNFSVNESMIDVRIKLNRQVVIDASLEIGFPLNKSGTCVAIEGPRFSTRAEVG